MHKTAGSGRPTHWRVGVRSPKRRFRDPEATLAPLAVGELLLRKQQCAVVLNRLRVGRQVPALFGATPVEVHLRDRLAEEAGEGLIYIEGATL